MPRLPRYEVAGGTFHVMSRGTGPCAIYRDDADRQTFLAILDYVVRVFGWRIRAFCLMDTHYHAVVETPLANLARGMQRLNSLYAVSFNKRHKRVGTLFQGRYVSRFIQTERHLTETLRYVANNPVRAGLCGNPDDWPWTYYMVPSDRRQAGA